MALQSTFIGGDELRKRAPQCSHPSPELDDIHAAHARLALADERLVYPQARSQLRLTEICTLTRISKFLQEVGVLP